MFKNISNYKLVSGVTGKPTFARTHTNQGLNKTTAFYSGYQTSQQSQSVNIANPSMSGQGLLRVLDGIINIDDPKFLRIKYKDMYYFDNIAGTAVDLRAELPFSEFTLTGISDPGILTVYNDCMQEMRILQFLRRMMVDYFVFGACAYRLLWDEQRKIFVSPSPLNLNNCTFIPHPLLNHEPFINYQPDEHMQPFIAAYQSNDKRVVDVVNKYPSIKTLFINKSTGMMELDPEFTLYFARNDLSTPSNLGQNYHNMHQLSYYARALKFYEYEKRIYRGTIDLAEKRLKSILHLQVGNENVFPEADTLSQVADLFKTANLDPTDAVVATQYYVNTNEIRQPTDFWRYDETYEFVKGAKLTALGINEEFLSGSANYSNMDMAMSVFLEQLKSDRGYVTDYLFTQKLFPHIAKQNGFISEGDQDKIRDQIKQESREVKLNPLNQDRDYQKSVNYQIPGIHWHKSLKPQGDKEYMDILQALNDQKVPIPIRMWCASAGVNVDELLDQLREDRSLRDKFIEFGVPESMYGGEGRDFSEDYDSEPEGFEGEPTQENPREENPEQLEQSSSYKRAVANSGWIERPLGIKGRAKMGDLNSAELNEYLRPHNINSKGKKVGLSQNERKMYEERSNKILAEILSERRAKDIQEENKKYSDIKTKVIR